MVRFPLSSAWSLLGRAIAPPESLTDPGLRWSARMLATCAAVLLLLFFGVDAAFLLTIPDYQPPWFGYLFLFAIYGLSRTRHFRVGALLAAAMFPLVALAHVASGESADPSVTLGFMALSPLVAALFLPMRGVLVLGIVNLCGIALLPVLAAQTSPPLSSLLGTSTSNSIATALA